MFFNISKLPLRLAATFAVVSIGFVTPTYGDVPNTNRWADLKSPTTCHAVAQSDVEFHQCRRDVMSDTFRTMLGWYREARVAVRAYSDAEFLRFQGVLHSVVQMSEAEFSVWEEQNVPFMISDPLHYIVVVRHDAPSVIRYLVEANNAFREAGYDAVVAEDADRFEMRLRLQLPRLDVNRFCDDLLPDLGCPEFGSAFQEIPNPEALATELAS